MWCVNTQRSLDFDSKIKFDKVKKIELLHNCQFKAAHCLPASGSPENYTVQYGNTFVSEEGSNVIKIAEFIRHEDYLPSNQYINDIGLVRLAEPIESDVDDFKVRLPVSGSYFETGTPSILVGWGLNATNGQRQSVLQKVDLQIYSSYDCNKIHYAKVHYTNICGGVPGGQKGQVNEL